jgi:lysophospholipase L1-like esterase
VGDSLTAQKRGYNYVDKVAGWLRQKYGDQAQVTNAGVGGDYLYRVRDRLEKDVLALKPTPTRVFIFLGHNDSKLSSASEYKKPVVAFEEVEGLFVELVKRIREKTGARVTIMSSTSSVHEITKATADKAREAKRAHNFFGVPEALETFNAGARKAAEATQSDYLDVYGPTKAHPNKPSLFSPDGVHLSIEGNRFIALEVLRRLGGQ